MIDEPFIGVGALRNPINACPIEAMLYKFISSRD
jgi:hypothetical protein